MFHAIFLVAGLGLDMLGDVECQAVQVEANADFAHVGDLGRSQGVDVKLCRGVRVG